PAAGIDEAGMRRLRFDVHIAGQLGQILIGGCCASERMQIEQLAAVLDNRFPEEVTRHQLPVGTRRPHQHGKAIHLRHVFKPMENPDLQGLFDSRELRKKFSPCERLPSQVEQLCVRIVCRGRHAIDIVAKGLAATHYRETTKTSPERAGSDTCASPLFTMRLGSTPSLPFSFVPSLRERLPRFTSAWAGLVSL